MDTTMQDRKVEIAEKFGIAPDRIGQVKIELDVLRRQGLLVDLDISGVGMFSRTASYIEMGWGDLDTDARRQKMGRAQKYLIPDKRIKELRSIETQMRQLLEKLSYKVTGFAPYRWLPFTAYDRFITEWTELESQFKEAKSEILAYLEAYKLLLSDEMKEVAEAAWKSITSISESELKAGYTKYEWAIVNDVPYDHDGFIKLVMSNALAGFPSSSKIESELRADYRTALVYGEQDVAQDQAIAQQIRTQAQVESEKAWQIVAMQKAEMEHARKQLGEIASPFEEVFKSLRNQIASDAREMLDSIKKNGFVRGKVAQRGSGLLEFFDLLAVQNDKELRERLVALRSAIGPIGEDRTEESVRDVNEVENILHEIVKLEHTAVEDLLAGPSRFSLIE